MFLMRILFAFAAVIVPVALACHVTHVLDDKCDDTDHFDKNKKRFANKLAIHMV